jgi:CcmD family protein
MIQGLPMSGSGRTVVSILGIVLLMLGTLAISCQEPPSPTTASSESIRITEGPTATSEPMPAARSTTSSSTSEDSEQEDAKNLVYLFAAFAITWIVLFLYAFFIARRQQEVEREVHLLRERLEEGVRKTVPAPE